MMLESLSAVRLHADAPLPLFRQLYEAIKTAILAGEIAPGTQLPPTRQLALVLGISRQTVLNAYSQLMAEGYFAGVVGRGTFVSENLPIPTKRNQGAAQMPLCSAMRPLSGRGERFVDRRSTMGSQRGAPRAFRTGTPAIEAFPFQIWARLEARRWRHPPYDQLGYSDSAGYEPLRELLAAHLRTSRGIRCNSDQILITTGTQQALFLIATLLLAPDDPVWVENPGYHGASAPLYAAGARLCPVPVDSEGLCVANGVKHYPDAKLVYVTPTHQYPLGVTMSLQRRLELLTWAAKNKTWVVEDDYDSEYRYTQAPLASLQSLDKNGSVIYMGTMSKVLFPGLRLGYLVLPIPLVEAFRQGKAVMDRHTSIVPQIVLADFIAEGHFNRHIKRTREIYNERRSVLLDSLATHLADEVDFGPSEAGLQLPITFKCQRDDRAVAQAALHKGLEVRALSELYAVGSDIAKQNGVSGLLLGFASIRTAEIKRGVAVLRTVLDSGKIDRNRTIR